MLPLKNAFKIKGSNVEFDPDFEIPPEEFDSIVATLESGEDYSSCWYYGKDFVIWAEDFQLISEESGRDAAITWLDKELGDKYAESSRTYDWRKDDDY